MILHVQDATAAASNTGLKGLMFYIPILCLMSCWKFSLRNIFH